MVKNKWVTRVITLLLGLITPFSSGTPCSRFCQGSKRRLRIWFWLVNWVEWKYLRYWRWSVKKKLPLCMGVINGISQSLVSKKSPTGPTERTPKPEHPLLALATYLGVRWQGHIHFFDGLFGKWLLVSNEKHGGEETPTLSFFRWGDLSCQNHRNDDGVFEVKSHGILTVLKLGAIWNH